MVPRRWRRLAFSRVLHWIFELAVQSWLALSSSQNKNRTETDDRLCSIMPWEHTARGFKERGLQWPPMRTLDVTTQFSSRCSPWFMMLMCPLMHIVSDVISWISFTFIFYWTPQFRMELNTWLVRSARSRFLVSFHSWTVMTEYIFYLTFVVSNKGTFIRRDVKVKITLVLNNIFNVTCYMCASIKYRNKNAVTGPNDWRKRLDCALCT